MSGCVAAAARCGTTFDAQFDATLDAGEAPKAGDDRVRMTAAVRDGDFAAFGL